MLVRVSKCYKQLVNETFLWKEWVNPYLMLTTACSKRGPTSCLTVLSSTQSVIHKPGSQFTQKNTDWIPDQDGNLRGSASHLYTICPATCRAMPSENFKISWETPTRGEKKGTRKRVGKAETTSHHKPQPIESGWNESPTPSFSWRGKSLDCTSSAATSLHPPKEDPETPSSESQAGLHPKSHRTTANKEAVLTGPAHIQREQLPPPASAQRERTQLQSPFLPGRGLTTCSASYCRRVWLLMSR